MSQIEVSKTVGYALLGPDSDRIAVTKVVAYMLLIPGGGGEDTSNRQGHVYGRVTRRLRS